MTISSENLRRRAKTLRRDFNAGAPAAMARVRAVLPQHDFALQCALYDLAAVKATLTRDPGAATRAAHGRSSLLHVAFSRHHRTLADGTAASVAVAGALVGAGADVNDRYAPDPGSAERLSALYGALGHAGNLPLAEWLLEQGANPDDNESLYHATELGNLDGLRLLMRFGVATRGTNALLRFGVATRGTNALLRMLDFDNPDGVRLLLDYGADPNEGADLIGTIIHGAQNRQDNDGRDHVGCARLALTAGATLRQSELDAVMDQSLADFLHDWAETHSRRVVS